MEKQISSSVRARATVHQVSPTISDAWRVTIEYISDYPDPNKVVELKSGDINQYLFVTGEYLEDKTKLKADTISAQKFALEFAEKQFFEAGREASKIDGEGWIFSNKYLGKIEGDVNSFVGKFLEILGKYP